MQPDEAFTQFYRSSKDACLRAVVASCADPSAAEEAVAEAFARAWTSWSKVSQHASPAAWVVRTALNHHVSRWRRTRREVPMATDANAVPKLQIVQAHPHDRDDLIRAVRQLPARQREVIAMRFLLDLTTEQTAQALGVAPGTVTAHLHRAITSLRAQAHEHEDTP
jgi:RNA polymerase sigma-70 factor (sigma-E family)